MDPKLYFLYDYSTILCIRVGWFFVAVYGRKTLLDTICIWVFLGIPRFKFSYFTPRSRVELPAERCGVPLTLRLLHLHGLPQGPAAVHTTCCQHWTWLVTLYCSSVYHLLPTLNMTSHIVLLVHQCMYTTCCQHWTWLVILYYSSVYNLLLALTMTSHIVLMYCSSVYHLLPTLNMTSHIVLLQYIPPAANTEHH